ncbi:MAG: hypothetical protein COA62_15840 [Rhodobiaceae bacterium]|nr:MAG: hypothetical protein COA62_15840 [Rhodobiaceae bacterium]
MNKARILKLADVIERREIKRLGFNMRNWFADRVANWDHGGNCGTVACIAGHAVVLFADDGKVNKTRTRKRRCISAFEPQYSFGDTVEADAQAILGLTKRQAHALFVPHDVILPNVTTEQAVEVLRTLANTGRVSWAKVRRAQPEGET